MKKNLWLLALACICCRAKAEMVEVNISSRIIVDSELRDDMLEELRRDSKEITQKYSQVRGVESVETTVEQGRCDECGAGLAQDDKAKPKEDCECEVAEAQDKCGACGMGGNDSRATRSILRSENCEECGGHTQVLDKIEMDKDGNEVCSECQTQLRSCKSCCKQKCCKCTKKCCSTCCNSTSSSSCCCK